MIRCLLARVIGPELVYPHLAARAVAESLAEHIRHTQYEERTRGRERH